VPHPKVSCRADSQSSAWTKTWPQDRCLAYLTCHVRFVMLKRRNRPRHRRRVVGGDQHGQPLLEPAPQQSSPSLHGACRTLVRCHCPCSGSFCRPAVIRLRPGVGAPRRVCRPSAGSPGSSCAADRNTCGAGRKCSGGFVGLGCGRWPTVIGDRGPPNNDSSPAEHSRLVGAETCKQEGTSMSTLSKLHQSAG